MSVKTNYKNLKVTDMAIMKIHYVNQSALLVFRVRRSQAYAVFQNNISSTYGLENIVHSLWRFTAINPIYL